MSDFRDDSIPNSNPPSQGVDKLAPTSDFAEKEQKKESTPKILDSEKKTLELTCNENDRATIPGIASLAALKELDEATQRLQQLEDLIDKTFSAEARNGKSLINL